MNVSRRFLVTAVLAAGVCAAGCHREQPANPADSASIQHAQDELSQPAWLRNHLPAGTVGYIRIASPWGLLGAAPNGRPLDSVMASEANLKVITALRHAVATDKTLADAGITPYLLPLLADLRSPVEVAMIDPISTVSPNTKILITMRVAQKSVDELNARFAKFEAPAMRLAAPLDPSGNGRLAVGAPLHFDVASGRLFALASRQPVEPAQLAALIAELAQATPDSDAGKAIALQEQQIDQSGQGTFAWISLHGLGGVAAGAIPAQSVGTLPGDLTAKTESVAFGAGTVDGHGRLRVVLHAPQARLLGYLAATRFEPDFKVAGKPRWVVNLAMPGAAQTKAFEDNLSLDLGAERAAAFRHGEAVLEKNLGFGMDELTHWIGPEIIGFEDDAGVYTAVRVNDRKALYEHLKAIARQHGGSYRNETMDGVQIHAFSFSQKPPAAAGNADPRQQALATLVSRFGTHFYWIEDGDFLIFAKLPQALADRGAARLDTSLDTWLKTHGWQGKQSLLGFTTASRDAQRDAYYGYLQMLQILGDLSGQSADMLSLPAAHSLKLPRDGAIGMDLGVTADDLSFNITYEQQPLEMLNGNGSGSMTTVAAVAIVAAIAIPAYQDYLVRAQVDEALALTASAKTAVTEYHQQHGRWPGNNQVAGLPSPGALKGLYVDSVSVGADGEIQVHFSATPPQKANAQLAGKTLLMNPEGTVWHCHSDDIPAKYLPASCRQP